MPVACIAHPRGFTDTKLPWSDSIQNDPCGKPSLGTVNGVDVSSSSLCLGHFAMAKGASEIKGVIVYAP